MQRALLKYFLDAAEIAVADFTPSNVAIISGIVTACVDFRACAITAPAGYCLGSAVQALKPKLKQLCDSLREKYSLDNSNQGK